MSDKKFTPSKINKMLEESNHPKKLWTNWETKLTEYFS